MLTLQQIEDARIRLGGYIDHTPCIRARWLERLLFAKFGEGFGERSGFQVWLKLETMQATSSFKERGAYNKLWELTEGGTRQDVRVVTASAGNHAQGVARAARHFGVDAAIVMPTTTPNIKVRNTTRILGKSPILSGANYDEAFKTAKEIADREQRAFVHAFDDIAVMAGQGTVGLEIIEDCPEVEVIVAGIGGGGLIAGVAEAVKGAGRSVSVIGVESSALPAAHRSRQGRAIVNLLQSGGKRPSIADGIAVDQVGGYTIRYIIDPQLVDELLLVTEEDLARALYLLISKGKMLVEGACAVTVAAMLDEQYAHHFSGRRVVLILSGGNIDLGRLTRLIGWQELRIELGLEQDSVSFPDAYRP